MSKEILKEYLSITNINSLSVSPKAVNNLKSNLHSFFFKHNILGNIKQEPEDIDIEIHEGKWLYPQMVWTKKLFVRLDKKVGIYWLFLSLGYDCKPLEDILQIQEKYKSLKKNNTNKKLFVEENKFLIRSMLSEGKILFPVHQYRVKLEDDTYFIRLDGMEATSWMCSALGYV